MIRKPRSPASIDLNPQFQRALDLMEDTNRHVFVTGRAGTGKSTLLTYFRGNTKKKVVVLAPTGVAAINVGGQTIHSFFGFKPNVTPSAIRRKIKDDKKNKPRACLIWLAGKRRFSAITIRRPISSARKPSMDWTWSSSSWRRCTARRMESSSAS
ncbi:MAG: AAA family ATPase [Deltaproteobacteria bacterium]|nr:AAA family ATPase [Deltaproteobacteria bacterium]